MNGSRLCASVVLILWLVAPVALSREDNSMDLFEAVKSGQVNVLEIQGIGGSTGDTIKLRVKRAVSEPLTIYIAPGTVFTCSSANVQNMVGSRVKGRMANAFSYRPMDAINLSDDSAEDYLIEAFCMDYHKDNPGASSGFSLGSIDREAAVILTRGLELELSINSIQAALWIHRDGVEDSDLKRRFPLDDDQLRNAHQLLAEVKTAVSPPSSAQAKPPSQPQDHPAAVEEESSPSTPPAAPTVTHEPSQPPAATPPKDQPARNTSRSTGPAKTMARTTPPAAGTAPRGKAAAPPKKPEPPVDETEDLPMPFRVAIDGDWKTMEMMVSRSPNLVNIPITEGTKAGWTPLHFAVNADNFGTATVLLNHGAKVNAVDASGQTPLHLAAAGCYRQMTVLLLALGADSQARTMDGKSPIQYSREKDCSVVTELISGSHSGTEE